MKSSKTAIHENLDPRNINTIQYVLLTTYVIPGLYVY